MFLCPCFSNVRERYTNYFYPKEFHMNMKVAGQDNIAVEVFENLNLSKEDVDTLWRVFLSIDKDGSGAIKQSELFLCLEIEFGSLEQLVFAAIDEDSNGLITFSEFLCNLWNILSLRELDLSYLAFLLVDHEGKGQLRFEQIEKIFELVHRKHVATDPSLSAVFNKFQVDYLAAGYNRCSVEFFRTWCEHNPSFMHPLLSLQLNLRRQLGGEAFWKRLMEDRYYTTKTYERSSVMWVKRMYNEVTNRIMMEREQARIQAYKDGLIGPNGEDLRDVRVRKNSFMMEYFGLTKEAQIHAHETGMSSVTTNAYFGDKLADKAEAEVHSHEHARQHEHQHEGKHVTEHAHMDVTSAAKYTHQISAYSTGGAQEGHCDHHRPARDANHVPHHGAVSAFDGVKIHHAELDPLSLDEEAQQLAKTVASGNGGDHDGTESMSMSAHDASLIAAIKQGLYNTEKGYPGTKESHGAAHAEAHPSHHEGRHPADHTKRQGPARQHDQNHARSGTTATLAHAHHHRTNERGRHHTPEGGAADDDDEVLETPRKHGKHAHSQPNSRSNSRAASPRDGLHDHDHHHHHNRAVGSNSNHHEHGHNHGHTHSHTHVATHKAHPNRYHNNHRHDGARILHLQQERIAKGEILVDTTGTGIS